MSDDRERITEIAGRLMAENPFLSGTDADKQAAEILRRERMPFKLTRAGSIVIQAASWLVRGFLEQNSFAVLYAPFGAKKSFVTLDLSFATVSGTDFMGRKVAKQGAVVYIAGEGYSGLCRRLRAWEIIRGVSLRDAPIYFSSCPANLCDAAFFQYVIDEVKAVADLGTPPVLIVIDTWSRNIAGDENSSLDSAAAVRALDSLRAPYGASVLVVHHSGWDQSRTRGSTVLMAAADCAYRLEKQDDDETVSVLFSEKTKDGKSPDPIAFTLKDVGLNVFDDSGEELTSAATVHLPDYEVKQDGKGKKGTGRGKNQRVGMDALVFLHGQKTVFTQAEGKSDDEARVLLPEWKMEMSNRGVSAKRIPEVISSLLASGSIGSDSRGFWPPKS